MDEEEGGSGGGIDAETVRSYVSYAKRALRLHRVVATLVVVVGCTLTVLALRYLPRTFSCKTVLMAQGSQVLDRNSMGSPLDGAVNLIMRHENLENIIRDIDLEKKFEQRRPPLLRFKDEMLARMFGPPNETVKTAILVGTLESRLGVAVENGTLVINADWSDGSTAAEVADAARESFVRARHTTEMSAFEEKLAILDGHAQRARKEVEELASQVRAIHGDRMAAKVAAGEASASPETDAAPRGSRRRIVDPDPGDDSQRELLDTKRKRLAELQADQQRRIHEEEARLADLKLRLGPSHPDVITEMQRLQLAQQTSPEIASLEDELKGLEASQRSAEYLPKRAFSGGRSGGAGGAPATTPEVLPPDIWRLLEQEDIDPTLVAQLRGAVTQYGRLRDDIRSGRVDLDTAQAAFNYRYKVVLPADPPSRPSKPKPALIFFGGLVLSLVLGLLLVPILLELRQGVVVARWQVHMIALPILGELRLPPHSTPPDAGPGGR
jgi:uncharacterized protein involved in exopolysaccharide biosynthesis